MIQPHVFRKERRWTPNLSSEAKDYRVVVCSSSREPCRGHIFIGRIREMRNLSILEEEFLSLQLNHMYMSFYIGLSTKFTSEIKELQALMLLMTLPPPSLFKIHLMTLKLPPMHPKRLANLAKSLLYHRA